VSRRAWTGADLSAEISRGRELIEALDLDGKVEWLERDFVPEDRDPSRGETYQRQASLDVASEGADWVIQLDSDEVVPDLDYFVAQVLAADRDGADGLEYSGRWLHTHVRGRWFTETSTRRMKFWDGVPGPVAVRVGTRLHFHRMIEGRSRRVTVGPGSDHVMPLDKAILHFSMVRTAGAVNWKSRSNSHANHFDWSPKIARWNELNERPLVGVARSLIDPLEVGDWLPPTYRFARLPARYSAELVAGQTLLGDPYSLRPPGSAGNGDGPKARVLAFHLPQFHPIPENDEWWGPGFTEWTNTVKARRRYPGHYQPHLPSELGFYDLRLAESRAAQAELAGAHGIEAFLFWHYWFGNGRRILERPVNEIIASGEPDFPFALAWANQTWSGIWHGSPGQILMEQEYPGVADERAHFEHILPALTDRRYLTVGGKPMFYVFRPEDLPDPAGFVERWQKMAVDAGLPGLYLLAESSDLLGAGPKYTTGPSDGFDASVYMRLPADTSKAGTLGMRVARKAGIGELFRYGSEPVPVPLDPRMGRTYNTIYPNWDNSPRSGRRAVMLHGSTPEKFRPHVRDAIQRVQHLPTEERLVFVKSWNEWAEGNHLEPDRRFGRGYLETIRDEVYAAPR
jgi:hypothetical protein